MTPRRSAAVLGAGGGAAAACALGVLSAAPAGAQPGQSDTRGMPRVVSDVLRPGDPGFRDPAVSGTRVLTPLAPGVEVACATGFDPVISCSTLDHRTPQRSLQFLDLPTPGGPALRIWFDYPRWGDGPTAGWNERLVRAWMTGAS